MSRSTFIAPSWLIDAHRPVETTVIGAGGTGGEVLDQLCRLHATLVALGHAGLTVTLFDGDTVSPANVGRQRYSTLEVGQNKAVSIINRINLFYGLNWRAIPFHWQSQDPLGHLLITATDSAALRHEVARSERSDGFRYQQDADLWLDFGNGQHDGQAVLGHRARSRRPSDREELRLPHIIDLYPDMADDPDAGPSCSVEAAIRQQAFGINSALVTNAFASLIWPLFRHGHIDRHGLFIDVATGQMTPLHIDPTEWAMLGYTSSHRLAS